MNNFLPKKEHDLYFRKAVKRWDEAIPLGAGLTGCLIWGDGAPLRFSLDRGDIWDHRPAEEVLADDYTYEELIKLVKAKDQAGIHKRFDLFYRKPTPTKIPAGRVLLNFGGTADRVESRLSLARAEAEITLKYGEKDVIVNAFMHSDDRFGYAKIRGARPSVDVSTHNFGAEKCEDPEFRVPWGGNRYTSVLGYPAVKKYSKNRVNIALQEIADGAAFAVLTATKDADDGIDAVFYVAYSMDGDNWLDNAVEMLENALDVGYDKAIIPHLKWWEAFWNKSRISLPDQCIEKNWYLNNYLLGSCSRKGCPPMPLQGVWTADDGLLPPWKGDYHGDLNTQFSYYNFLKSDHLEEGESFIDFLWNLNDKARDFAKNFFDTEDGLCLPSVFSFNGTSLGGWPQYATNITNQIWETHIFYMYYKYTADEKFLHERLYPYLKGIEAVVNRQMVRDENGKLTLPLSTSPEMHDNTINAWFDSITTFDLALVRYLYEALTEFAPICCPEEKSKWEEIYAQLPEYPIDETNGFMLSATENITESHRHFSHLMPIQPLDQYRYNRSQEEKEIIDKSLDHLEHLGRRKWYCFSFTWLAHLYGRALNGPAAAYNLQFFFNYVCSQNGFDLNGDFRKTGIMIDKTRPFTLESNMHAADAIQEMLLQCYDDVIRVFPAVPEEWLDFGCEFEDFLSYGNVKVSAAADWGEVKFIRLNPRKDYDCKIYNPFNKDTLTVTCGDESYKVTVAPNEVFTVKLTAGKEYTVTAK